MEHCLAGIQTHCPDNDNNILAGSLQQINVTVLLNYCFLQINEKYISFSIQRNSDTHHQLFREMGSLMVQPLLIDFRSVPT